MAIEDIFRALDRQAEEDSEAMLAHARAQAERLAEDAKVQAGRIREDRLAHMERDLGSVRNQRLNTARLEAKKKSSAEREALIQEAFKAAEERVRVARDDAGYADAFERLLTEAATGASGDSIEFHVDPRDEDLARKLLAKEGLSGKLVPDLSSGGGVKVTMSDGTICRLNTLESRLAKARRVMKSDVAAALFGS